MRPVKTLGKSLEELRDYLDIAEAGERTDVDGLSEIRTFRKSGLAAKLTDGCVVAVFLYSDGYDSFVGFQGDTGGLRLDSSKQIIRFKFGYPTKHREGETESVLGTVPNFDRYDYEDYSLHFQYDESGVRLRMLTILSSDEVRLIDGASDVGPSHPVVYDKAKYHSDSVQELGLPEEQSAVLTAFFLGWLMDNDLCSAAFVEGTRSEIAAYKRREMTALEVYAKWDYCLVGDMLNDEGNAFAQSYFDFSNGRYIDDFVELLARKLPSEFHVPYTWKNQKKIGHSISKRYNDWKRSDRPVPPQAMQKQRPRKPRRPQQAAKQPAREIPERMWPSEKALTKQPPARYRKSPSQHSGRLFWFFKFVIFPILAVAAGLAIIIYADSL